MLDVDIIFMYIINEKKWTVYHTNPFEQDFTDVSLLQFNGLKIIVS